MTNCAFLASAVFAFHALKRKLITEKNILDITRGESSGNVGEKIIQKSVLICPVNWCLAVLFVVDVEVVIVD